LGSRAGATVDLEKKKGRRCGPGAAKRPEDPGLRAGEKEGVREGGMYRQLSSTKKKKKNTGPTPDRNRRGRRARVFAQREVTEPKKKKGRKYIDRERWLIH